MSKKCDNEFLTIQDAAQIIFDDMYGMKRKNLLEAYSCALNKYKFDYSYEEIKDYLFHNTLEAQK